MDKENEQVVPEQEEEIVEEDLEALDETTDWKAKAQELERKRREDGIKSRERTKALKAQLAELKPKVEPKPAETPNTGELDETQLDYLDLKGITEQEDIDVVQKVMQKSGQTLRQALKDEYVVQKLAALKGEREVKAAIPSSTKRGSNNGANLDALIAKAEQSGEYPDDFELRTQVVNALEKKNSVNVPSWRR